MFLKAVQEMISKRVSASAAEKYALLPSLWNVMTSG